MQMSRERFQEVHKLIWNTVIANAEYIRTREETVRGLKWEGIDKARKKGLIDEDEEDLIVYNNNCLLCSIYGSCVHCPLETCASCDSLYAKATRGDVDAMIKIRDIVDIKPFIESSIITLHDWRD